MLVVLQVEVRYGELTSCRQYVADGGVGLVVVLAQHLLTVVISRALQICNRARLLMRGIHSCNK
jgi:hypothetical protein